MFSPKTIKTTAISESIPSYHLLSFVERELAANHLAAFVQNAGCENQETRRGESPERVCIDILSGFSGADVKPSDLHGSVKTFTALLFGGQMGPHATDLHTRDSTRNWTRSCSGKLPESASSSNEDCYTNSDKCVYANEHHTSLWAAVMMTMMMILKVNMFKNPQTNQMNQFESHSEECVCCTCYINVQKTTFHRSSGDVSSKEMFISHLSKELCNSQR